MSIMRLESALYGPIDARYIDTVHLLVQNSGGKPFEMLVHGYGDQGLTHQSLIHVGVGAAATVPQVRTNNAPFQIIIVTNINQYNHTIVTIHAYNQGQLVAVYTQEDMARIS